MDLFKYHEIGVNDKPILRICKRLGIKSIIKYRNHGCIRQASNPQYIITPIEKYEYYLIVA